MSCTAGSLCRAGRNHYTSTVFGSSANRVTASRRHLAVKAAGDERQSWDFGRFVKTVLYFNPPPSPQQLLSSLFKGPVSQSQGQAGASAAAQGRPAASSRASQTMPSSGTGGGAGGVVLVTGATSAVGRLVVAQLLARGRQVRVLGADVSEAQSVLGGLPTGPGGELELVGTDVAQGAALPAQAVQGVGQVVCCQGGDAAGTLGLLSALAGTLRGDGGKVVYSPDGSGAVQGWGSLDDVVMGGVSESFFFTGQGGEDGGPCGVFMGTVTTANNGGFASVRTRNLTPPLDLSGYEGVELRVRGDGKRYKLIMRSDPGWDAVGYTQSFDTRPGWQTVRLRFPDFRPVFRARTVLGLPPLNTANIFSLQLMLSKFEQDGLLNPAFQTGRFELPVQRISAFKAGSLEAPRFVLVGGEGAVAGDEELRASGVPFTVVQPASPAEGPEIIAERCVSVLS